MSQLDYDYDFHISVGSRDLIVYVKVTALPVPAQVAGPPDSWHPGDPAEWKYPLIEQVDDEGETHPISYHEDLSDQEQSELEDKINDLVHDSLADECDIMY